MIHPYGNIRVFAGMRNVARLQFFVKGITIYFATFNKNVEDKESGSADFLTSKCCSK